MPNFKLTIFLRDVAEGDVNELAESILDEHGESFDADRGDLTIQASMEQHHNTYYPFDLDMNNTA